MKKNMTLNEEILNGYTIEITNSETGEVQWFELKSGRKFTRKYVTAILEEYCGWSLAASCCSVKMEISLTLWMRIIARL